MSERPRKAVLFAFAIVADISITHLAIKSGIGAPVARCIGLILVCAVSLAARRSLSLPALDFRGYAVQLTAALVNFGIFYLLISRAPQLQPTIAVLAGWVAAIAYALLGHSRLFFRHRN